jgi:hypothetical protein
MTAAIAKKVRARNIEGAYDSTDLQNGEDNTPDNSRIATTSKAT